MNTQARKTVGPSAADTARMAQAALLIAKGAFSKPSLLASLALSTKDNGNERLAG